MTVSTGCRPRAHGTGPPIEMLGTCESETPGECGMLVMPSTLGAMARAWSEKLPLYCVKRK